MATADTEHFLADGTPYRGQVYETEDGKSFGEISVDCWRCRGSGHGRRGGRCPECGGARAKFDQALVFTQEQLDVRLAGRERRSQKKMQAEADRLAAIRERHEQFVAEHQELFDRAAAAMDIPFVRDLMEKSEQWGGLTQAQVDALQRLLDRKDGDAAAYAGSAPVGVVGETIELELYCRSSFLKSVEAYQGRGMENVHINEFVDQSGNAVSILSRNFAMPIGQYAKIRGTVKGGDDKRGWHRTFLSKPVLIEQLTAFSTLEESPSQMAPEL